MAENTTKKSELKYHNDVEEFIPYTAYFDEETIITKNGELMQVIKVTGFSFETIEEEEKEKANLRSIIRKSITDNFKTSNFAFWFHTLRRKRDISCGGSFENEFSDDLNKKWTKRNNWNEQFVNELYISIIIEGEGLSIKSIKLFFETAIPALEMRKRNEKMEQAAIILREHTDKLLADLSSFGAIRLGIIKKRGVYYSEIMSFISKIMNLKQEDIPIIPEDISEELPSKRVVFQYNTVQVEGETERNYGSIFSVKEYREILSEEIDKFLQLPVQFIVSECFDFVNNKKAIDAYNEQKDIYRLSGSEKMLEISGIKDVLASDKGRPTDFGEHQIIITVLKDTVKEMQNATSLVVDTLREMGVVFIREDLYMENCYWSQMPANFDFIRRQTYIPTEKIGGFASLYNFPAGKMEGNIWGDAVTVFRTLNDTPYFFNFHYEDDGHTSIIGPFGTGKTVLMNFLVSEAQKFKGKTYYFEQGRGSEIFIRTLGGSYHQITKEIDAGNLYINPLLFKDNQVNREFLKDWFGYLIDYNIAAEPDKTIITYIDDDEKIRIDKAVELVFSLSENSRILSYVIPKIWDSTIKTKASEALNHWCGIGAYAKYFDSGIDNTGIGVEDIIGFDMSIIVQNKAVTIPMVSYLLHKVEDSLTGEDPTIIVLDEAWKMIDNKAFAPRLEAWMKRLKEKNAIVIFATESVEQAENSAVSKKLFELIKTQLYLPNGNADEGYLDVFGLDKNEYKQIKKLETDQRQFLLKHNNDSIVAKLSLEGMDREMSILSSSAKKLKIMEEVIAEHGRRPAKWLEAYYHRLNLQ